MPGTRLAPTGKNGSHASPNSIVSLVFSLCGLRGGIHLTGPAETEWAEARSTIARFDDAIMKIRTLGLPGVSTLTGVGTLLGSDGPKVDAKWWAVAGVAGALGLGFILIGLVVHARSRALKGDEKWIVPFEWYEALALAVVGSSTIAWIFGLSHKEPGTYPFAVPVLAGGAMILLSIYLLDRFYYTILLKAAVTRAIKIEKVLGYELTGELSSDTHSWSYTLLPTIYYLTPIFILLNVALAVAVYAHVSPSSP